MAQAAQARVALIAGIWRTWRPDTGSDVDPEQYLTSGTTVLHTMALARDVPGPERAAYQAACYRLAGVPGCDDLDGWVISLDEAGGSEPPLHLLQPGLRDEAWALHGPDPGTIVTAPAWAEQLAGLEAELAFLRGVPPEHDAYAVLNACRIVRSLAERDVVQSKFGSAAWALEHLPAELGRAIRAALSTYRGTATAADAEALAAARPTIEALAGASFA